MSITKLLTVRQLQIQTGFSSYQVFDHYWSSQLCISLFFLTYKQDTILPISIGSMQTLKKMILMRKHGNV